MGACTTCRKAKRKCQYEEGEIICKRCQRLSLFYGWVIECIPHVSGQGVRKCGVKGECNAVDDEEGPGSGFLSLEDSGSPDNDSDVKLSFADGQEDYPPTGYCTGVDDDEDIVPELMMRQDPDDDSDSIRQLVDDKEVSSLSQQQVHRLKRDAETAEARGVKGYVSVLQSLLRPPQLRELEQKHKRKRNGKSQGECAAYEKPSPRRRLKQPLLPRP